MLTNNTPANIPAPRRESWQVGGVPILTVAAYKGGVGKTTLALELAYLLDAVLVDLEWDEGGASRRWGYRSDQRRSGGAVTTALDGGKAPRPLAGNHKARLVPGDPDLGHGNYDAEDVAARLVEWSDQWGSEWVVVDTHPGANAITLGAMRAAHCIVVPTPLEMPELDGLEGLLREAADYPLLLVPNKVPYAPPAAGKRRLRELATHWNVAVGPVVSSYRALGQRQQRMAVSAIEPTPARWERYVDELRLVADEVKRMAK